MPQAARDKETEEIQAAEAEAVAEILQRDARQKALLAKPEVSRSRHAPATVAAIVLGATAIALWVFDPAWLRPERVPAPSRAHLERSGRLALFMVASRIEDHRTLRGRLPLTLDELGVRTEGVRYALVDERRYQLSYRAPGGQELVYDSEQNMSSFLGNALSELGMLGAAP